MALSSLSSQKMEPCSAIADHICRRFPQDSPLRTLDEHRSLPPATTYSTRRHVLSHPAGAPLGAPAPQQEATQKTTAVQTVQKLNEGEGDTYFNLNLISLTCHSHPHTYKLALTHSPKGRCPCGVVRVTVCDTEDK